MLVIDDDADLRALVTTVLRAEGLEVVTAADGREALQRVAARRPDLIVCDVEMPVMDGFTFVEELRAEPANRWVPLVFLTTRRASEDVIHGLALGADDYVTKPFRPAELVARVQTKLARPPAPAEALLYDRDTGLATVERFDEELRREHERIARGGEPGTVAVIALSELGGVASRLGQRSAVELVRDVGKRASALLRPLDLLARLDAAHLVALLPGTDAGDAARRLEALLARASAEPFEIRGERLRTTPSAGFTSLAAAATPAEAVARARTAADHAIAHLDLTPTAWQPAMEPVELPTAVVPTRNRRRRPDAGPGPLRRAFERSRTGVQLAMTLVIGFVLPFILYWRLDVAGFDITAGMYVVVVVTLFVTGALILWEGLLALRETVPPDAPASPEPPATAIIAAYLPNEAATIVETVEAFRRLDYPAGLQIIVAYNSPTPLPVELELAELAEHDPRVLPLRVEGSTSKAQNVNTAIAHATGDVIGMFDADHHPDPDAFRRAWRWISHGDDVVQGHCLVRNGDESNVAKLVAVEFESIYAVSHPGRARMHGFGVFGGSNGFWRTELLHTIRMRGGMLTEDIDSSLRVVEAGGTIRSDPGLISRELATATWSQLWNQRMRWAQGWFQVSMRHLGRGLRSKELTVRNKLGLVHLLLWRELYPWLTLQMFPLIAYWIWRGDTLDWLVPIFVLTTLFTLSVGPIQTWFAYKVGHPSIAANRRWFLRYLLVTSVFYTEYKNTIARIAQIKEAMRERAWKVTPRSADATSPDASTSEV